MSLPPDNDPDRLDDPMFEQRELVASVLSAAIPAIVDMLVPRPRPQPPRGADPAWLEEQTEIVWREVFLAALRGGFGADNATQIADQALDAHRERFSLLRVPTCGACGGHLVTAPCPLQRPRETPRA